MRASVTGALALPVRMLGFYGDTPRSCHPGRLLTYMAVCMMYMVVSINGGDVSQDYYTSPIGIQKLIKVEQKLLAAAFDYINTLETRINKVKSYLEDYEQSVLPAMTNVGSTLDDGGEVDDRKVKVYSGEKELEELAKKVSSHPLMTYRLIRRFALELKEIERDVNLNHEKQFLTTMEKVRKGMTFPKAVDLSGAMEGIIRVQDAYNLDLKEFSEGNFMGIETNVELRAIDCYQIGLYAFQASIFTRAVQWLERSLFLIQEQNDKSVDINIAENAYRKAVEMHNKIQSEQPNNPYVFTTPFTARNANDSFTARPKLVRSLDNYKHELYHETESILDLLNFAALCSGKVLQPASKRKSLTCHYKSWKSVPYFLEKVEVLHKDPFVYQIYDVLTDVEIDRMLEVATPFMSRAKVLGKTDDFVPSAIRTSSTHWIAEKDDTILAKLPRRIELITGLDLHSFDSAEDLQISSYGIGGHYNPHFDTLLNFKPRSAYTPHETKVGERIATFMFYLSSLQRGGGTAFPRLGVIATPIKGSSVYWHNVKPDGTVHPHTLHGGCPVLLGTKHVANKWIRSNAQMFRYKCPASGEAERDK